MTDEQTAGREATIQLNGETLPLRARSVAELLGDLGCAGNGGVAVAVNGEIVPRSDWSERALRAGDRIELLGAVQGG